MPSETVHQLERKTGCTIVSRPKAARTTVQRTLIDQLNLCSTISAIGVGNDVRAQVQNNTYKQDGNRRVPGYLHACRYTALTLGRFRYYYVAAQCFECIK